MNDKEKIRENILSLWGKEEKERTITVQGTSMIPLIKEGDSITFRPLFKLEKIKIGDIAVFNLRSSLVVHRIVDRICREGKIWFREKGDNNFLPSVVPEKAVLGKVVRIGKKSFCIHLTSLFWTIANSLMGWYWKIFFMVLGFTVKTKKKYFYKNKTNYAASLNKKILHFLIRLPLKLFRPKH